jgi:drug/metabolite transporter (DMT)-like permease
MRAAQLMIAISAVLYGTQGIFAALAYDHGASVGVLLAVRAALFCVLALFLFNRRRRDTLRGHRRSVVIACITPLSDRSFTSLPSRGWIQRPSRSSSLSIPR